MKNRNWVLLAGICLILLAESAALISTRWVEDDSWYSSKGWTLATEGRIRMSVFPFDTEYIVNVVTTLHSMTLGAVFKLFGLGIAQARLTSALFAIALVIVVYLLASDIAGPKCGLIAALLTATDSILLVAARTARPEAETAFLCWLALLLFARAIARHSPPLALCGGIVCGLGLICHPMGFPFFVVMMLYCGAQYRWKAWKEPVLWATLGGVALVLVPYLAWCFSDQAHISSFRGGYLNRIPQPLRDRIAGELMRWSDFIGISNQRVPLLPHLPLRLHVAVILIVAIAFFARRDRRYGLAALTLLVVTLGWLVFMITKTPRYLSILTPLFAIALAYFAVASGSGWLGKAAGAALALVLFTNIAGNAFWLYRYRHADYAEVSSQLRQVVPQGSSVYGVITFWMALHDRTYYAFERTDFDRAVAELRPQYIIMYDRVMVHGSGYGDDWAPLREKLTDFVHRRGTLAGRVANEFYGDLEIYRVAY